MGEKSLPDGQAWDFEAQTPPASQKWSEAIKTNFKMLLVAILITLCSLRLVLGDSGHSITQKLSSPDGSWTLDGFTSLVTFGDSYTDESRGLYFRTHNFSPPPVGWVESITTETSTGGYVWPRYVNFYSRVNAYNYAEGGAVCNKNITAIFPVTQAIQQYELSAFAQDNAYIKDGAPFLKNPPMSTVYAIWIGTNDLGVGGFLLNNEAKGKTLTDFVNCNFNAFHQLYQNGARKFVLMNVIPLHLTPAYAPPEKGSRLNQLWGPPLPSNLSQVSLDMQEQVSTVNAAFRDRAEMVAINYESYPDANIALFDVHSLFHDMYNNPTQYLNGSAPANVTGSQVECTGVYGSLNCVLLPSPDSYLWHDFLHPSEQAGRVVAKEFLNVVSGNSKYATYFTRPHLLTQGT